MSTYRKPATDQARERANAYQRQYRRNNPDRVKAWRDNYALRRADKLRDQARQQEGGEQE